MKSGTRVVNTTRISGLAFLLLGGILALGACTEEFPPPMQPPVAPDAVPDSVQTVFATNCLGGCHSGSGTPGAPLDLSTAEKSYSSLVNVAGTSCGPLLLVKPFESAMSCNNLRMKDVGNPMPPSGIIAADQIAIVDDWVDQGALPAGQTPPPPPAVPDSVQTVFTNSCISGCHAGGSTIRGSLDLSTAEKSYSSLVNVAGTSCGTLLLVKPSDSAMSCNNIRMKDTGSPMPPGGVIAADQIAIVDNWVDQGALPAPTP